MNTETKGNESLCRQESSQARVIGRCCPLETLYPCLPCTRPHRLARKRLEYVAFLDPAPGPLRALLGPGHTRHKELTK